MRAWDSTEVGASRPQKKRSIANINGLLNCTPLKSQRVFDLQTAVTPMVSEKIGLPHVIDPDITSSAIKEAPGTVGAARGLLSLGVC